MKITFHDVFEEKQCAYPKCSVWEVALGWTEGLMPHQSGIDEKFFVKKPSGNHEK